ncbi:glycine-rich RNA-binding, abscisic acid-inducible protein-like [Helianthus annuus]|uniref:glycine-rich RNA-binding, abscisic acid-inducible protein-like n=1 Tax=Helianthus annuus TaxID=4232 RepID=UPI000B8F7D11|nr:glycine-rich RNA-binding, abscisic acid-inducible protein-like [Helianthus annuus]
MTVEDERNITSALYGSYRPIRPTLVCEFAFFLAFINEEDEEDSQNSFPSRRFFFIFDSTMFWLNLNYIFGESSDTNTSTFIPGSSVIDMVDVVGRGRGRGRGRGGGSGGGGGGGGGRGGGGSGGRGRDGGVERERGGGGGGCAGLGAGGSGRGCRRGHGSGGPDVDSLLDNPYLAF